MQTINKQESSYCRSLLRVEFSKIPDKSLEIDRESIGEGYYGHLLLVQCYDTQFTIAVKCTAPSKSRRMFSLS